MSKTKDEFAGIEDVKNAAEEQKWQYPSLGFSTATGDIFMGDDKPDSITGQIIAYRECKEVNTGTQAAPSWTRYHKFTKNADMVVGIKVQPRLQVLINIDGQIYNFGCKSWTSRALFLNTTDGKWSDAKYKAGLIPSLQDQIEKIKTERGVTTGLGSWTITISKAKNTVTNDHTGKEMFALDWSIDGFAGKDLHISNDDLIATEELAEWAREWSTAGGNPVDDNVDQDGNAIVEDDIDNIPGFPSDSENLGKPFDL